MKDASKASLANRLLAGAKSVVKITVATWITLFRASLIPLFAFLVASYAQSRDEGPGDQAYRIAALCVFLIAALSDAVDGIIARYFNQKSRLGAWLDPLVDKILGIVALIFLSLEAIEREWRFPLWFTIIIITKDTLILLGCMIVYLKRGSLAVRPNFAGKITTFLLLFTIVVALWRPDWMPFHLLIKITAAAAVAAFILYLHTMMQQLKLLQETRH